MSQLHEMPQADGSTLLRMTRPASWDHMEWCQLEGCDERTRCASVYSLQPAGEGFIGWRAACSHKHALVIWHRELSEGS